tara:strand:- start:191 stop:631 length:441 start_codon:yes stop_codon:yes gene_type:complete
MNPQTEKPPFPEIASIHSKLTFAAPNLLLSLSIDGDFKRADVREGRNVQLDFVTETSFGYEPVDEKQFSIKLQNKINFAKQTILVLNDAIEIDGFRLVASVPTTSEYLAMQGQKVITGIMCRQVPDLSNQHGSIVYRTDKTFVIIP